MATALATGEIDITDTAIANASECVDGRGTTRRLPTPLRKRILAATMKNALTTGVFAALFAASAMTFANDESPKRDALAGTSWKLSRDGKFRVGIVFQADGSVDLGGEWATWESKDGGGIRLTWPDANFVDFTPAADVNVMTGVDHRDKRARRLDRIPKNDSDPVALANARTRYLEKLQKLAHRFAENGHAKAASAVQREIESVGKRRPVHPAIEGSSWRLSREGRFRLMVTFQKRGKVTLHGKWAKWQRLDDGRIRVTWPDANHVDLTAEEDGRTMKGNDARDGAPRTLELIEEPE